jgi:hypothetical protein
LRKPEDNIYSNENVEIKIVPTTITIKEKN